MTRHFWLWLSVSGAKHIGQGTILVHDPLQSLQDLSGDREAVLPQHGHLPAGQTESQQPETGGKLEGKLIASAEQ